MSTIKITLSVSYPNLNPAELERLRTALRSSMLPACMSAAETVTKDDGTKLKHDQLIVDGEIKIG
jgi:hypothetical protein